MNVLLLNAYDAFAHDLIHKATAAGYTVTATTPSLLLRTPAPTQSATLPTHWRVAPLHDRAALRDAMSQQDVALLHLPNLDPLVCPEIPTLLEDTIALVRSVLDAALSVSLPRLVLIASTSCLGTEREKPDELSSYLPTHTMSHLWAETQYCAEREILSANSYRMDTCTLLTPTVLSASPIAHSNLHQFARTYAHTTADQPFAYLDYRDLARTALRAIKSARPGQRYALQGARATCTQLTELLPAPTVSPTLPPDRIMVRHTQAPARIQPTKARGELQHKTRPFPRSVQEIFVP